MPPACRTKRRRHLGGRTLRRALLLRIIYVGDPGAPGAVKRRPALKGKHGIMTRRKTGREPWKTPGMREQRPRQELPALLQEDRYGLRVPSPLFAPVLWGAVTRSGLGLSAVPRPLDATDCVINAAHMRGPGRTLG